MFRGAATASRVKSGPFDARPLPNLTRLALRGWASGETVFGKQKTFFALAASLSQRSNSTGYDVGPNRVKSLVLRPRERDRTDQHPRRKRVSNSHGLGTVKSLGPASRIGLLGHGRRRGERKPVTSCSGRAPRKLRPDPAPERRKETKRPSNRARC